MDQIRSDVVEAGRSFGFQSPSTRMQGHRTYAWPWCSSVASCNTQSNGPIRGRPDFSDRGGLIDQISCQPRHSFLWFGVPRSRGAVILKMGLFFIHELIDTYYTPSFRHSDQRFLLRAKAVTLPHPFPNEATPVTVAEICGLDTY